jgi:sulfate/thiosulfate transport system permease protein
MTSTHALRPNRVEQFLRSSVILYIVLLVAFPLVGLVHFGFADGLGAFWAHVNDPVARSALWLTIWTAVLVGVINTFLGTATAWVLVRYSFPGRPLLSALVDLPLAVPTLVAGVMLAILYGPKSMVGESLRVWGFEIMFAAPGIVLALLFVTLPFVVRAIEPLLAEIDPAEEEAAVLLGAGPIKTFRTVFLPAILPAALSGGIRSVGRALGEFGSTVMVAGNIPFKTLTAPVLIFGEIESGQARGAAAVSTVLLVFALAVHAGARFLEQRAGANHAKG